MHFPVLGKVLPISNKNLISVIDSFGSIEAFFEADLSDIEASVDPKSFLAIKNLRQKGKFPDRYEDLVKAVEGSDCEILCYGHSDYPPLLAETIYPPAILFVKGSKENLFRPQIAVVGSRKATAQGVRVAFEFAKALASAGFAVTSGLAAGIDSSAHSGALAAKGLTCAIMGTGIDQIYPARNKALANEILASGGVIAAEFLPGSPPRASHFPQRNRIVTGLSLGVLVVEASERSGSLISARLGAEQGREVFAVPGSIFSPVSAGCNKLIRDGATLVTSPDQVVEQIGPLLGYQIEAQDPEVSVNNEPQHWLIEQMGFDPVSVDQLCELTTRPSSEINAALSELELEGLVAQTAYGYQRLS